MREKIETIPTKQHLNLIFNLVHGAMRE
jgi:hypothetical protein